MSFTINKEYMTDIFGELEELFELHKEYVGEAEEIAANYRVYAELEDSDKVVFYTCRNIEGKVVGYASFFISSGMHFDTDNLVADLLFVSPDYQGLGLGKDLLKEVERSFPDHIIYINGKVGDDKIEYFLNDLGYYEYEVVYKKDLRNG